MKHLRFFRLLPLLLAVLGAVRVLAQTPDGPVGVAVTIKALDLQWASTSGYVDLDINALNNPDPASATYGQSGTSQLTARLEPGKSYHLSISSEDLNDLTIQAVPPPGYIMEIERVARERLHLGYGGFASVQIRVRAPMQEYAGRAGVATSLTSGRIFWQVALGSLANGSSAGALAIIDTGTSSFSSLFTPAGFLYEPTSSEVQVFYNPQNVSYPEIPGAVRQIIAPEACVDIITVGPNESHIKFYHHDQLLAVPNTGLRGFRGAPYTWFLINQDGVQPNKVFINCDVRELPDLTDTGAPVVQTKHTVLERTGSAPNFTWKADEWYEGSTSLSRDERVRNNGVESITVSQPGGDVATRSSRTYGNVPWGEEIMAETRGTTDPVTTSFDFYTTSAQAGNYGHLRSTATTGGTWEAYEYYDYAGGTADEAGALYRTHRPFKSSDTTVPGNLATHNGLITTYAYAPDAFGRRTRPALVETTIEGKATSRSNTTYAEALSGFAGHDLLYVVTATNAVSASGTAGDTLTTISKYFREDAGANVTNPTDDFFRGQIHSIQQPDGRKQSFVYQRGTWDGTTFVLSGHGGTDYGVASRISVITGTTSTGTAYGMYGSYDLDDLFLVEGMSTMKVTIRDASALVRRTESHVWTAAGWELIDWVSCDYNYSNLLVSRTTSGNGQYEASYVGERKDWEKDDAGTRVDYTYDAAGRVSTATKSSGPTTTYTYDAEHRTLSENVTAAGMGENIYSSSTYDDAGRLHTELPVGMSTVSYSYDVAGHSRKTTYPDTSYKTETFYADGQLDHVDGPAVVPQYYTYAVEADGRRTVQTYSGSLGSPRWEKGTMDWLGRPLHKERPGFAVTAQAVFSEDNTYEPGTGRLLKTARGGLAPTRYEYDAFSNVVRTGLDIGDNGLVPNSSDRITDSSQTFEKTAGSWWLRQETKTYPRADGTAVTVSVSRKRLTGHPVGRLDETQVTDAEGNLTNRTVDVDRANATVTVTTAQSGFAVPQVEKIVNGLTISTTGHDGLTLTAQYDGLSRTWKNTDSRNNTFATTYKPGTALVQSVTDGAGKNLGTASFDDMGRKKWTQDAAGQYTRFAYNLRGQLTNQWGDGTHPVQYGYDPTYGDRTSLSTYRAAPAGDSVNWPAVGTADTTTFVFDAASGLIHKKIDAAGKFAEFSYNGRGQTLQRFWARTYGGNRVTSTYAYDGDTGELRGITYNDSTPAVAYEYSRLGELKKATDGITGERNFGYDNSKPWRLDHVTLSGFYGNRVFTTLYEGSGVAGRARGFQLGSSTGDNSDLEQAIAYNTGGHLETVESRRASNSIARTFRYGYLGGSSLVQFLSIDGDHPFIVTRGYEDHRDLLTSITSKWNGSTRTRFNYTYNDLYQRDVSRQSGDAFADYGDSTFSRNAYNARGELTAAPGYMGSVDTDTSKPLPGRQHSYDYDSIGNRKSTNRTGNTADKESYHGDQPTVEGANQLNQYETKQNKKVAVQGTVDDTTTVSLGDGSATSRQGRYWAAEVALGNSSAPAQGTVTVQAAKIASGGIDLTRADTRTAQIAQALQNFSYDEDGNLTSDGMWDYHWDAENRLYLQSTTTLAAGAGLPNRVLEFRYDYMGRRVQKRVLNGATSAEISSRRYLFTGWNVLAEFEAPGGTSLGSLARSYTWGLDLTGSQTASGGVGALVQIHDHALNKTLLPTYDGNGDVASLLNADTGSLEAAYEYDAFGQLLRCEGAYAKENPFRFSTKWQDQESGLINYGYRCYSPGLGRFINRDPIAEDGGLNLYGFCGNDGVNHYDYLGQSWLSKFWNKFRHTIISAVLYAIPVVGPVLSLVYNTVIGAHYGGVKGALLALASGGKLGSYAQLAATTYSMYQQFGHGKFLENVGNFLANRVIWQTAYHAADSLYGSGEQGIQNKTAEPEDPADTTGLTKIPRSVAGDGSSGLILVKFNKAINDWEYFATDKILTRHVFVNGIVGSLARHIELMEKHFGAEFSGLKQFTLMNNPTHGPLSDIFEATLDIIGISSRPARVLATGLKEALGRGMKLTVIGHSQGGAILTQALRILQVSGTSADGMTVIYHAAASNSIYATNVARSLGATFGGHAYSPSDAVAVLAGMNGNIFQIIPALIGLPDLLGKPTESPHSEPNAVAKYPWTVWYP